MGIIRIGSICSGSGMLDEAVMEAVASMPSVVEADGTPRLVWQAERDVWASRLLAHHYKYVPNFGPVSADTDWFWVADNMPIHVLVAGFPCQDVSDAGRKAGLDGDRSGLWHEVARAIGILDPGLVCVENVTGLLSRGGTRVIGDLARMGYVGSWLTLGSNNVGAPHVRQRFFLVAAKEGSFWDLRRKRQPRLPWGMRVWPQSYDPGDKAFLPTVIARDGERGGWSKATAGDVSGRPLSEVILGMRETILKGGFEYEGSGAPLYGEPFWGKYWPAVRNWTEVLGRSAPDVTVSGLPGMHKGTERLSARFCEWMMGWPPGWASAVPDMPNKEAVRIIGNGVHRQQATAAFRRLLLVE